MTVRTKGTEAESTAIAINQPTNLLEVIAHAVADPRMDVDKMRQLFELQKDIMAEDRRTAFFAALSRVQQKLPQIQKDGKIMVQGQERSRYTKLETIDEIIKPIYIAEGFAVSYDTVSADAKLFNISCKLSHSEGHSETKSLMVPIDASKFRSDIQSIGSSLSYAKRQLLKMHFNIIEVDEDNDGLALEPISEEEARDLEIQLQDTKSSLEGFLKFMQVGSIREIRQKDLGRAQNALAQKRRKQ